MAGVRSRLDCSGVRPLSKFEILSVAIACVAAFISLYTWVGQRKLQRESIEMQRATSELAKKQLELLVQEDKEKRSARLKLDLIKENKGYKFYVTNIGNVEARNVSLELLLKRPEDSPLVASDYESKFPAPVLHPGSSISLLAALHLGSPTAFNAKLKWMNPDGKELEDETFASL